MSGGILYSHWYTEKVSYIESISVIDSLNQIKQILGMVSYWFYRVFHFQVVLPNVPIIFPLQPYSG